MSIPIPGKVFSAGDPVAELEQLMEPIGFTVSEKTSEAIRLSRGSMLGDFSVKIAKLYLTHAIGTTDAVRLSVVSAVPVPNAVWLFGSGLLGLVSIFGRQKA